MPNSTPDEEMAGDTEPDYQETQRDDFAFDWDQTTQLYFHASSGFYHDPSAGWFYSSRDGLYYKFENGSYVLLECSDKVAIFLGSVGCFQCQGFCFLDYYFSCFGYDILLSG